MQPDCTRHWPVSLSPPAMDHHTDPFHNTDAQWRESVALIAVRARPAGGPGMDLEVFSLPAHSPPYFGPLPPHLGALAKLPSSPLHPADLSPLWIPLLGPPLPSLALPAPLEPPMVRDNLTRRSLPPGPHLSPELALRVCALRCLFATTGVLLKAPLDPLSCPPEPEVTSEWAGLGPEHFLLLFTRTLAGWRPRVESVRWWANWMTPATIGRSPRFDSLFCLLVLPPHVAPSGGTWHSPDLLLRQYATDPTDPTTDPPPLLSPAELYELAMLASLGSLRQVELFADGPLRETPLPRWIPSVSLYADGSIAFLPGDHFYPSQVDLTPRRPPRLFPHLTLQHMRSKRPGESHSGPLRLNRIEQRSYWCRLVVDCGPDNHTGRALRLTYPLPPVERVGAQRAAL